MSRISREIRPKTPAVSAHEAEALALRAIAYIAADEKRLSRLMALAGIAPQDLRERLSSRQFLAGILEFVLGDEAMVIDFAATAGLPPESVARALAALSGQRPPQGSI